MICGFGPEPSRVVVQFQAQFCLDFPCLLPEIVVVFVNQFLGCVCFGCSTCVRGGLLRVVVPVEFFSSSLGLTTRLPPNIESRSSARDCKISHRLHICKPLVQSRTSARDCKILHRPHICKPHDIRSIKSRLR